ncbi:MAG TPA: hypothetical protein P5293_07220, partial [Bacteroidales bacterium]|nr:hypothetical protein [Bacteroidales bacterium]
LKKLGKIYKDVIRQTKSGLRLTDNMVKFNEYLYKNLIVEATEKLVPQDKNMLKTIIRSPRNTTITLKSFSDDYTPEEREIEIVWKPPQILIFYNKDFYELTNYLVDFCDNNGLEFKSDFERQTNTQYFYIWKEKK